MRSIKSANEYLRIRVDGLEIVKHFDYFYFVSGHSVTPESIPTRSILNVTESDLDEAIRAVSE